MAPLLTIASSGVVTGLHSGGGCTGALAWMESVCTFRLGVDCFM